LAFFLVVTCFWVCRWRDSTPICEIIYVSLGSDRGGLAAVVTQPVLPLTPAEATPIGPIAALVDKPGEGGVVYVNGLATFVSTPAMRWGAGWRR
jgi:hypothetical protein